ncbi:MAG: hypothetical protein HKN27_03490 [Silicimonas sp.]|nr:hypothetical protein [Silicimonas sp.]
MFRHFICAIIIGAVPRFGLADGDFGTREEAKSLAEAMISIVDDTGIEAAIKAMHDVDQPFVASRMGVNLFSGSTVIADNREPETIAADYSEMPDLSGALVWPIISAAAMVGEDANLKWYHYDTQEAYDYKCFSKRSASVDATVMVCR